MQSKGSFNHRLRLLTGTLLVCAWAPTSLLAHYVMGPVEVNRILKSMQRSRQVLQGQPPPAERQEALFTLGLEAYTLMKLINTEIKAHGDQQKGLINLALKRSRAMGTEIRYLADKSLYLYDFEEFQEYLKLSPAGEHAAEARFALIEQSFYQHEGVNDPDPLLKQLAEKQTFLQDYPDFGRRAELEVLLALDYYELYFIYQGQKEALRTEEYKELTLGQCRHIMETFPGTDAANFAMNMLLNFGPD